jgi:hypothetical protein
MVLPLIKGYLQGGGLQKLIGKAQEPQIDQQQFI